MDTLSYVAAFRKNWRKLYVLGSSTETHVGSLVWNGRMGGHLGLRECVPVNEHTPLVIARIQGFLLKWSHIHGCFQTHGLQQQCLSGVRWS
jgi:hypothetical protein